ncbi:MAG TPA: DivIVA domain-containing protein [Pseudonocardiaceae bacterium]|nr:DivIVA domain-containing protein [Pseudonocardiaceae bacterium]
MYRVFESLDELVTILEEARGVPMTSGCVVPRGDALELLDEVRDNIPAELDDAQDVLDRRDEIIANAEHEAEQAIRKATAEAEQTLADAEARAERMVAEAGARADALIADAENEAERAVKAGRAEYEDLVGRGGSEAERMVEAGRLAYERSVQDGRDEQARLVSETDVAQAAHAESARILDAAAGESDRLRGECDQYVDGKLGEFEELLAHTLRSVGKGRTHLRAPMANAGGVPFDYRD